MRVQIRDLHFAYPGTPPIFEGLSLTLGTEERSHGSIVAIVGASGTGKTTFLRLLASLEQPTGGAIEWSPAPEAYPGFLFQESVLLPQYSRLENARYRHRVGGARTRFSEEQFVAVRGTLGLSGGFLDNHRPLRKMSGGEGRRLALLREMSSSPGVLYLDEPCAGLDRGVKAAFLQSLRELADAGRQLVFYATHHRDEAESVADDVVFLFEGDSTFPGVQAWHGGLMQFVQFPPTLGAARFLGRPFCNVATVGSLERLGVRIQVPQGAPPAPGDVLAFQPDVAKWDPNAATQVRIVTRSALWAFVAALPGEETWCVPVPPSSSFNTLNLDGPGWLFRQRAQGAELVVLGGYDPQ